MQLCAVLAAGMFQGSGGSLKFAAALLALADSLQPARCRPANCLAFGQHAGAAGHQVKLSAGQMPTWAFATPSGAVPWRSEPTSALPSLSTPWPVAQPAAPLQPVQVSGCAACDPAAPLPAAGSAAACAMQTTSVCAGKRPACGPAPTA